MNCSVMDYKIVIWGADDSNVLGLLRALKDYGVAVLPLFQGRKTYIASASKYCHNPLFVSSYKEGLNVLIQVGKNNSIKPFLITSTDLVAEYVDQNKEMLSTLYYLPGTEEAGRLTDVLDKYQMSVIAESIGFTVPRSLSITHEFKDNPVGYPCLIKPYKNVFDHSKEFKTKVCYNKEELLELLETVNYNSRFVLQEYIDKDHDLLIYGCRLYNGEVILAGSFKKDRWYKHADGSHGYISKSIPSYIQVQLISEFLKGISYYGLFSFEFGVKNEIAYFYEVNLRNDGTSHYFLQAGANLPLLWVSQFNGIEPRLYVNPHDEEFMDEVHDYLNIKNGIVDKKVWKSQSKTSSIYRYYDKKDMMPYIIQLCEKYLKLFLMPLKPMILRSIKK